MNGKNRAVGLMLAAVATIVLWQLPVGRYVLYPLTILATWFHEMAHGLCALALGGSFVRLQLFPNGSGYAVHSGVHFLGPVGWALVAAAGPIGPAIGGALMITASLRAKWSQVVLSVLALAMLLSVVIWIRTLFGFVVLGGLALVLLLVVVKGDSWWRGLTLQFIGVQACISTFLQVGYLFTERVSFGGQVVYSDTGQIAEALLLPYWFWALLLTMVTLWLPLWSLRRVLGPRAARRR